jgi:hypothetical protein
VTRKKAPANAEAFLTNQVKIKKMILMILIFLQAK